MSHSEIQIIELVGKYFGLKVTARALQGYEELNFLLKENNGNKYICKLSPEPCPLDFLDARVKIIHHLSNSPLAKYFQWVLKSSDGPEVCKVTLMDRTYYMRILSFLEGTFWVDLRDYTKELFLSLGTFLAEMDNSLNDFSHPALKRHYEWDIANAMECENDLGHIRDHEKRRLVNYFLSQFRTEVIPVQPYLRKSYIHNDANDYNLLVSNNKISGLIDFGDMVYSHLINNLAVACTYAMLGQPDPLQSASWVVQGYHLNCPLTEQEVQILYYLIAARLCISVTRSAKQASGKSDNEHHFITEKRAWELLFSLIQINPLKAHDSFRRACGFSPLIHENQGYAGLEKRRNENVGQNLSISYKAHLKIEKGALQYLYDDKGNTYLDCVNNVSHVGHCHPKVVQAMQKQISILNTNTRYLHDKMVEYAEKLKATLPPKLKVCYFTNSGSEANDLAVRISRHFTKQEDIIVIDHAYHGTSTLDIEMSPYKFNGKGGSGQKPYIHIAMDPDLYRGKYRYDDKDAGKHYAADVKRILDELKSSKKGVAAFICESLQGVGGQMPLPAGYLEEVYGHVRNAGGICIADEVQTGFGRVGSAFWGFELQGVEPDIMVFGKPAGNGHPLAGLVITEELAQRFSNGMEYFNTYGGNPVSMATGLSVLNVIEEEELQKNALETGSYLLNGLRKLMDTYPIIGDVRGQGLFIGIELVKDKHTFEPAVPEIDFILEEMKNRGFLIGTDGPLHNVLKIKPPIIFSKANADDLVRGLDKVLECLK